MERLINYLDELRDINYHFNNDISEIDSLDDEIRKAKVCVPIIGKFSSGKTALVNSLLDLGSINGKKILTENITPETAVPTELEYGDCEMCRIIYNDGRVEEIGISEYVEKDINVEKVSSIRLILDNSKLRDIKNVMIVDLPGFESGIDIHNKAIDNYCQKSMVYLLAIPADDMILKTSIINILKELSVNKMRICVVITKMDKANDSFDELLSNLKTNISKYVKDSEVIYCETSAREGKTEDLTEFLYSVDDDSKSIIYDFYLERVKSILNLTSKYLKTRINKLFLTESQLEEEKDDLERRIDDLNEKLYKERDRFNDEVTDGIESVKGDLHNALYSNKSKYVTMSMSRVNISGEINMLVRSTVSRSVSDRITPIFKRYLSKVEKCIDENSIQDFPISIQVPEEGINKSLISSAVAVSAGVVLGLSIPVIGVLAFAASKLFGGGDKKAEQRRQIESKLEGEIFPRIISDVSAKIEQSVIKQLNAVEEEIEKNINQQKETILKAIDDVKEKINEESKNKEEEIAVIEEHIARLEEINGEL